MNQFTAPKLIICIHNGQGTQERISNLLVFVFYQRILKLNPPTSPNPDTLLSFPTLTLCSLLFKVTFIFVVLTTKYY